MCCGRSCGATCFSVVAGCTQLVLGAVLLAVSNHKLQTHHGECLFGHEGMGSYVCPAVQDLAVAAMLLAVGITIAQGLSVLFCGGGQLFVEFLCHAFMVVACLGVAIFTTIFSVKADNDYESGSKNRHTAVALTWALFAVSLSLAANASSNLCCGGLCCLVCCCATDAVVAGDDRCMLLLEALGLMWCLSGLLERRRPSYQNGQYGGQYDPLLPQNMHQPYYATAPHTYAPPPQQHVAAYAQNVQPVIGTYGWQQAPPQMPGGPAVHQGAVYGCFENVPVATSVYHQGGQQYSPHVTGGAYYPAPLNRQGSATHKNYQEGGYYAQTAYGFPTN